MTPTAPKMPEEAEEKGSEEKTEGGEKDAEKDKEETWEFASLCWRGCKVSRCLTSTDILEIKANGMVISTNVLKGLFRFPI